MLANSALQAPCCSVRRTAMHVALVLLLLAQAVTGLKLKIYIYNTTGHALNCGDHIQSQSCA